MLRQIRTYLGFHPRRWLRGWLSHSRYIGYIRPALLTDQPEEYRVRRKMVSPAWKPRQLFAPAAPTIVVIAPHPDDESIGAGGFLLAHRGYAEVHLIVLCSGDAGGSLGTDAPADPMEHRRKMTAVRRRELSQVEERLNFRSVHHFDYPDGQIEISGKSIEKLRSLIEAISPQMVLLPWFLDNQFDHRRANVLYAAACSHHKCTILGYEIWSPLEPNAFFDITGHLAEKLELVKCFQSQLATVDYLGYAEGLAKFRAYHTPVNQKRSGAVEAFVCLPGPEYCEIVNGLNGLTQSPAADAQPAAGARSRVLFGNRHAD